MLTNLSPLTRAREALMIVAAGGAMRATGWRATAIRFQQFGEVVDRVVAAFDVAKLPAGQAESCCSIAKLLPSRRC